jgi:hypothetical protein
MANRTAGTYVRSAGRRSSLVAGGLVAALAISMIVIGPAAAVSRPVAGVDAARAARARSDMEFAGLGDAVARTLVTSDFGTALSATTSAPSELPAVAGHVVRWLSEYKALIRGPGGGEEVATSNVPLDTGTADGSHAAVDLELRAAHGGFAPRSPVVPTWIPDRFAGGLNVGGVRLSLAGSNAPGTVLAHNSVFYGNVARDVDVVFSPTLGGGETFEVLRSRRSPQALSWQLGLPAGAEARVTSRGLSVIRSGRQVAEIPSPVARDAQGQSVPVTMSLVGRRLVLTVAHRRLDVTYPILVDPVILFPGFAAPGGSFVTGTTGDQGQIVPSSTPFTADGAGSIIGAQDGDYSPGELAQWTWAVPGGVTPTTVYYSYDFLLGQDGQYTYDARGPYWGGITVDCSGVPMYLGTAMGEVESFTVTPSSSCSNNTASVTVGTSATGSPGVGVLASVDVLTINTLPHSGAGGGGSSSIQAEAEKFEPVLRFDSSEKWRPLNVDDFLQEGRQYLCDSATNTCDSNPISGAADLADDWSPTAYIKVYPGNFNDFTLPNGFLHDASAYRSPWSQCWADQLWDCDTGSVSAIYYGVNDPTPTVNYKFIDYWYFYRANLDTVNIPKVPKTIDWHEGDWEGMTVALDSYDANTFDFAAFSQHGTFYDYLRSVLRCEDSPSASIPSASTCGTQSDPAGSRIDDFVSEGDHANFTTPCSAGVSLWPPGIKLCRSSGSGAPFQLETNYDGTRKWGNAFADPTTTLLPLPAGASAWTNFPGTWGSPNGLFTNPPWLEGNPPRSPGDQSFNFDCATFDNGSDPSLCGKPADGRGNTIAPPPEDGGPPCDPCADIAHPGGHRGRGSTNTYRSPGLSALSCASWAGPGVGAAVCNPTQLARAVRNGTLGRPGNMTISCTGPGSVRASGPGVAQCADAAPLDPHAELSIAGVGGSSAIVLVRTLDASRRHVILAQFDLRPRPGARAASAGPLNMRLAVSPARNGQSNVTLGGQRATVQQVVS